MTSSSDGRLSDALNGQDVLTFNGATLEALGDGREVAVDQLEVEWRDLHLIEIRGRRGDPVRRLRTVEERVVVEVGPYVVTGNLHRPPSLPPLAALSRWAKFVPVTDAAFQVGADAPRCHQDVLLVNRERIARTRTLDDIPSGSDEPRGSAPAG